MTASPVAVFAALGDETRWRILGELGAGEASASALASRMPVSRQAIAKHLAVLAEVGLVEPVPAGRELRYRAIGARLDETARLLERTSAQWDARLARLRGVVEG